MKVTEIFAEETYDLRSEVMWPDKSQNFVVLEDDKEGVHFGLWKDDKIISVISLFIKGNEAQFRKFATAILEQGYGFGTILLKHLMTFVVDKKINRLWCNARADKVSFYESFGMRQTSQSFKKGGIRYIIMEKHSQTI